VVGVCSLLLGSVRVGLVRSTADGAVLDPNAFLYFNRLVPLVLGRLTINCSVVFSPVLWLFKMSKTRSKRSLKPEGKLKTKDPGEAKKREKHDDAQTSQKSAVNQWSDWIWDEELKGYYRAKLANGGEHLHCRTNLHH
jgi:hypothetical protein